MALDELCYLALGELALGTKAYDPKAMDGLALFLRLNGYSKKIEQVVLDSGLLPLVPSYYGLSNAKNMRFLGTDPKTDPNSRAELALKGDIEDKDKEYIEKFVLHKITSREQAASFAKDELKKLTQVLRRNVEWHYMHGEEDRKNIEALEELKINDYMRIESNRQDLEAKLESSKKDVARVQSELDEAQKEKSLLQYARRHLRLYEGKDFRKKVDELIKEQYDAFSKLSTTDANKLKHFLRCATAPEDVKKKLDEIYKEIKELNGEIKYNQKSARDCQISINAIEREREASGFFRITKRQHIQADEEEILYRLAKKEYNDLLYTILPKSSFHVHSDSYADLDFGNYRLRIYHSMNFSSDSACSDSLSRMKKQNSNDSKQGNGVADIVMSTHGKGGFRFQPQPKYTEDTIRGEERETPEIAMDIKLPTFQSYDRLAYARKKNIKNWHTKRFEAKNYAAGAVIHTIKKDGVHEVEYIDVRELVRFGEIAEKLGCLYDELKLCKTDRDKEDVQLDIDLLEEQVKINTKKVEVSGDQHIGCPNVPGRPSNYDLIRWSQEYQHANGLPDIMVTSEVLHGTLEKIFSSNKQYFADVPKKREDLEQKILADENLDDRQKLEQLQKLYKTNHESIPITSNSVAKLEAKRRIIPYLERILVNGGKVVLVSGNHYNCSCGEDEAFELASMLPVKYIDNEQVQIFDGLGAKYGSGTLRLENGQKLYSAHKPKSGTDEIAGAMNQALGANLDASILVFFDRHHTGGGYADNSCFVAAPGMQPWNKYVDAIGKYPGLRGIVNLFYDTNKRYYKWQFVLDPTLEGGKTEGGKNAKK